MWHSKTLFTTLLCAVGAAALPGTALAEGESSYVERNGDTLTLRAYPGFDNNVSATMDGNRVIFKDSVAILRATLNCQHVTGGGASCLIADDTRVAIFVGDGANRVTSNLADDDIIEVTIGAGEDSTTNRIEHYGRPAELSGGPGADTIIGGSQADALNGNGGDDLLQPRGGRDEVNGGPGVDLATYADHIVGSVRVSLDGLANDGYAGENDNVKTENVTGGSRADVISGSAASNLLNGGGGDDEVRGAGGADSVYGGGDDDTIEGGRATTSRAAARATTGSWRTPAPTA